MRQFHDSIIGARLNHSRSLSRPAHTTGLAAPAAFASSDKFAGFTGSRHQGWYAVAGSRRDNGAAGNGGCWEVIQCG